MNPIRFRTGAMITLSILLAVTTAPAVEIPFLQEIELGDETPGPNGSVVADFDGDGDNDIVAIAGSTSYIVTSLMVKMFESDGAVPPSYTLRAVSPGGFDFNQIALYPKGVDAADIDADLLPDVASCSLGKVSWHETNVSGSGEVTFTNHVVYLDTSGVSGSDFLAVSARDLNGDGRIDLLAANNTADEIWLFLNREDESDPEQIAWTRLTAATGVAEPSALAVADLNMDGHMDVVVADTAGNRLLWLQNDGGDDPVFTVQEISATEDGIRTVAVADLNADGYPEIFSGSSGDGRVAWWSNGGGAVPSFAPTDIATVTGIFSLKAGDLDNDGDMDLAAGSNLAGAGAEGALMWFDSDGVFPPTFTARTVSPNLGAVQSVSIGDVDGDGDGDILSGNATDDALYVLENRLCATGFPARFEASSQAFGADAIHAADLTGDGVPEIIAASLYGSITWFANDGNTLPTLTEADEPLLDNGFRAQSVTTGDIDGDGTLDVLATSEAGNAIIWFQNGGGNSPSFDGYFVADFMLSARDAVAADVDGDGDMDVVGTSSSENKVSWFESDGSMIPIFTERVVTRNALGAWSVYADDVDADGDTDIVSASFTDGRIVLFMNDGATPPAWSELVVFAPEESVDPGAIDVIGADMDGDGDTDLVAASVFLDKIAWYENILVENPPPAPGEDPPPPTLTFTEHVITQSEGGEPGYAEGASSVFAGDLDADGDLDLVVTAAVNNRLAWFESNGQTPPVFFPRTITDETLGGRSAVATDLNGDGRMDIAVASAVDNSISTFLSLVGDTCMAFDASRDGSLNAAELAWIGRSFGLIRDGESPDDAWWKEIDFDGDGRVDGEDLSILGSSGVWGRSVLDCSYSCNN